MHFYLITLLVLCVVTDSREFQSKPNFLVTQISIPTGSRMRQVRSASRMANAPQAVGYKCLNCNGEFLSRHAMDVHRRHPSSSGTPCTDPSSFRSLSFTGRADMSTGILRRHDIATLGASACVEPLFPSIAYNSHNPYNMHN